MISVVVVNYLSDKIIIDNKLLIKKFYFKKMQYLNYKKTYIYIYIHAKPYASPNR